ncbi:putative cop9 signalosome complex subunit 4 protein [Rhypophila decipiens]|uniref:COP9 signalosome complex subunit 4 n=1 Tax=Rhypophila decipiens TaxID=261697 RepID=A0AAN7B7M0_9PEZI|nr:putative cop9 signalosome complex subunit 4 protein [Rhypophila decipiens]
MVSPQLAKALSEAPQQPDQKTAYQTILSNVKTLSNPSTITDDLVAITDAIFSASLGVVDTRAVLATFISTLRALSNQDDLWIQVGTHILSTISSNPSVASSLHEEVAIIRGDLIATAYEANEDFLLAAKTLSEVPLDSSQRRITDSDKVAIWIRIVRNYLEVDDSTAAEMYLNKLKNVMHTIDNAEQQLHFKLSAARIQDSKRQFLAAAQSYYEISFSSAVAEEERLHTLSMAIKCAILAPAGPPRSRVLGWLYKDERSAGLEEYGMLEKMFLDRLLAPSEVDKFAKGLAPHQLATTSDGSTVLARAVVEHNLLGASRLYANIGFEELGLLLGLDGAKAEDTTAKMIEQGRLKGSIDQIDRMIWFDKGDASGEKGSGRADVLVGKEIRRWDGNVQALAEDLERLTDSLQSEFPEFVAAQLAVA